MHGMVTVKQSLKFYKEAKEAGHWLGSKRHAVEQNKNTKRKR